MPAISNQYSFAIDRIRRNPRIVIAPVITLLLGLTGPFGTALSLDAPLRYLFWGGVVVGSMAVVEVWRRLAMWRVKDAQKAELLALAAWSAMGGPLIWCWASLLMPVDGSPRFYRLWVEVACVTLGILVLRVVIAISTRTPMAGPAPLVEPAPVVTTTSPAVELPRLFQRLPGFESHAVECLTASDHYVIVGLANGDDQRLLMRLNDAIAEMAPAEGLLTHRSHWVLADAIDHGFRASGRDFLRLKSGRALPVSRNCRPKLIETGITFDRAAEEQGRIAAQ